MFKIQIYFSLSHISHQFVQCTTLRAVQSTDATKYQSNDVVGGEVVCTLVE